MKCQKTRTLVKGQYDTAVQDCSHAVRKDEITVIPIDEEKPNLSSVAGLISTFPTWMGVYAKDPSGV